MEDEPITVETAELAKAKGFDVDLNLPMPTQGLLRKWLLKTHHIHIELRFDDGTWTIGIGKFTFPDFAPEHHFALEECDGFKDALAGYEEALEMGLKEALELIKS